MSLFSKLFGGGGKASGPAAEAETYKDYTITPEPVSASGGYRIGARIEKEVAGEVLSHSLIRADTCSSTDEAVRLSILKAKQVIDQQGDAIFK